MSGSSKGILIANLTAMGSMIIWAAGLPAADVILRLLPKDASTPQLLFSASRMALAGLFLLPVWIYFEGWRTVRSAEWLRGVWVGSLIGLGAVCVVLGQSMTDAVTFAIIAATLPLLGTAIEVIYDGKKITMNLTFGLLFSIFGAVVALGSGIHGFAIGPGIAVCLLSNLFFAIGSRLSVTAFPDNTALGRTSLTVIGGAIATTVTAFLAVGLGGVTPDPALFGWWEFGALAFFAVGGMAISQLLWLLSVGKLGVGLASLHINATPFYVMIIMFALGGSWNWMQAAGAALVGVGVLIAQDLLRFAPQRNA
ncbi:MAG: hypothetical protein RIR95_2314 [Pseudomonadota bacterium]